MKSLYLKLSVVLIFLCSISLNAQTLSAGDIALIQYNADGAEIIKFLALKDIPAGEIIYFTDNGWQSPSNTFRTGEGTHTWTSLGVQCGEIVTVDLSGPALSGSGDQLLAYQGSSGNPTFITALNSEGTGWQTTATSSNTSAIPQGLTNGIDAVALNEIDNAIYNGTITNGDKATILGAINNKLNWSGHNTTLQDFTGQFTVTDCAGATIDFVINEVDADTPGTDTMEFVELYDGGVGNSSLDGLVLVFYNGSDDQSYASYDLDGQTTNAEGYFVIGNAAVPNVSIVFSSNGLQNGADAVALYVGDGTDFPNDTVLDTSPDLLDAFVYDTSDSDDAGILPLLNAGQAQINEGGGGDKDAHSNQRIPNGSGGARNTSTYAQILPTPGAENGVTVPIDLVINEVDADTPGSDTMDFVELYDGGVGNSALDGLVLVFYNGSDNQSYASYDLDGETTNAEGYFVIGHVDVPNVSIVLLSTGLQNGADAVALYVGDGSDFPNDTVLNTSSDLLDALVYDTSDGDDAGLLPLLNAGQAQINENGLGNKDGHSNQRIPNGSGGARNTSTYIQTPPTPGVENCVLPTAVCTDITVELDALGNYNLTPTDIDAIGLGSSSPCGAVTLSVSPAAFNCNNVGPTNTVTLTVTDESNNSVTCEANVVVEDNTNPTIILFPNITVQLDLLGNGTLSVGEVDNGSNDPCGILSTSINNTAFTCADIVSPAETEDLIISEYVEGSGFNKYIEIYNGTGDAVDLAGYQIRTYFNANTSSSNGSLSGMLLDGETIVYRHNSAVAYAGPSTVLSVVNWNGNDAIALWKLSENAAIDIFGNIGQNIVWNQGGNSTQNRTLVRNSNILVGNVDNAPDFPALGIEWTGFPTNDVSNLGSHSVVPGGSPSVTLTVVDNNGNEATATVAVTVEDNIDPTAVCTDITIQLDDSGNYSLTQDDIDAIGVNSSDACGIASFTVDQSDFDCSNIGATNTVEITVIDKSGNESTCSANIIVEDNIAPIVLCANLEISLDPSLGTVSIVADDLDGGSFDTCSGVDLTISQSTFDCDDIGAIVISNDLFISEYIEGSGNSKCIEIYNGTGSTIDLSDYDLVRYFNGSNSGAAPVTLSGTVDDGDVHVICNSGAATLFLNQADQTTGSINFNGDDAVVLRNNGAAIDIFGKIGEDPGSQWVQGGNSTANNTLVRNPNVFDGNTDDASGFPALGTEWIVFASNTVSNLGSHSLNNEGVGVTLTATDAYGNSSSCIAVVTLEDDTAPNVMTQDITIALDSNGEVTILASQVDDGSEDNCGIQSMTVSPDTFDCDNLGDNEVTLTVTDVNGNSNSNTANVEVIDNEAPVIADCFAINVILNSAGVGGLSAAQIAAIEANVSDNCEIADINFSELNFDCTDTGGDLDVLIISEYVDGIGTNPGDNDCVEIFNGTGSMVDLFAEGYQLNVYENGSPSPTYSVPLLGTIADGEVYVVCNPFGTAQNQADQTGGFGFDGNDAVELSRDGNAVDIIGEIGVDPGIGWVQGANTTAGTTLVRNEDVFFGNINDVTGIGTEWEQYAQNDFSDLGSHTIETVGLANNVILTVTDTSGNISTCEGNVTVLDNTAPTPICQSATVQLNSDGVGTLTASAIDNGSFDNCAIKSLEIDQTTFDCNDVGTVTVTLTVTDVNDLTASCQATVTVVDGVAPEVNTQNITVQLNAAGTVSIVAADVDDASDPSNDTCGINTLSVSPSTFDCSNVGANTVTLTATDINGNSASASATVTVEDNVLPTASCGQNLTFDLDATGSVTIEGSDIDDGSDDACGILSLEVSPSTFGCDDLGENTVTLTVTDNNGNESTCTTTITIEGDLPVVTFSESDLPELCQGDFILLTAISALGVDYEWFLNGVPTGDDTQEIEVSQDGTYGVNVTSATNCTTYAEHVISGFDLGALISAYTILAEDEVFLHGANLVQTGGVGAMNPSTGNIKLHQASNIVGFGQAVSFDLNQGSTIGTQVLAAANPTIPAFVVNTFSNNASPNATINTNQTQNLTGSVYGTVTVKSGAVVTFTQSNVYIDELKTFSNATIEFAGCTNVFINEKFMLAQDGVINSNGNNVVFYVNEDVQIEKGSDVRARIHTNGNEILAKGENGNGNNMGEPTFMTGLFIANKVHGNKNVIWNADPLCDPCPIAAPLTNPGVDNPVFRLAFDVNAWPNPSDKEFNVKVNTTELQTVQIDVFDMSNKLVHSGKFDYDETYKFGKDLEGGVYIVKITQNKNVKSVRLVKY